MLGWVGGGQRKWEDGEHRWGRSAHGVAWVCAGRVGWDSVRARVWGMQHASGARRPVGRMGGQHGGRHVGWEVHTVGGWHILCRLRQQEGEWRGWVGRRVGV